MAKPNREKGRAGAQDAREKLAAGWGQMTANMVSPNGGGAPGGGSSNGSGKSGGAAPLPISALPLPADEAPAEEAPQTHSLPTNSKGELSPAQRARLGLDIYGDDQPAPAAPAQQPQQPATPEPTPQQPAAPAQQQAAPSEFKFNDIDPYAQPPAAAADAGANAASRQGPAAIPPGPAEQPRFKPISEEPKLAPVSSEPKLAPVGTPAVARARQTVRTEDEYKRDNARRRRVEKPEEDAFEAVARDRSVLAYGVAWTVFAIVVTAAIAFTSAMGSDPAASAGPGPLVPGLLSIAMGWVIVIAARGIGKGWGALMLIPALVLFIGPYFYRAYWSTSVEDAARSYLSSDADNARIDVDNTSVVSQTIDTDRGCFGITRTRSGNDTQVAVVTYVAATARQQADFALAPRYAGHIPAGGDRALYRVFNFKGGRGPAIATIPRDAPLDCANSVSSPGQGADPTALENSKSN